MERLRRLLRESAVTWDWRGSIQVSTVDIPIGVQSATVTAVLKDYTESNRHLHQWIVTTDVRTSKFDNEELEAFAVSLLDAVNYLITQVWRSDDEEKNVAVVDPHASGTWLQILQKALKLGKISGGMHKGAIHIHT